MDGLRQRLAGERRVLTALFCDIVGSTTLAETMDPEDWADVVADAMDLVGRIIDHYGGTVSEFAGDAVVAIYGAPTAHEDDPYRAVRSGLDIVAEIRDRTPLRDERLEVRVGIHTGLAVVGDIEAASFTTYAALGDALNVAARLQTLAAPGSVVISAETRRLLGSDVDVHKLGPAELKGRAATVEVFEVESVKEASERRRGLPSLTSPIVGRTSELRQMENIAAFSSAGTGRVAAVLGEPGVGKSRLVEEVQLRVEAGGDGLIGVGTCVPFDEDLPFHLVAGLVRSLAGVGASEHPNVARKAIGELCSTFDLDHLEETFGRLIGVVDGSESTGIDDQQALYAVAVIELLGALSGHHRPIVLVCEDVQWADRSSVDLMTDVVTLVPTLPILLILVMRNDRSSVGWSLLEHARREIAAALTEIHLQPLDAADSQLMVANLLEIESLPPTLRRLVLDKAEGNPFFLEEVVRMLTDGNMVEHRNGRWIATDNAWSLKVPETIQGLLASRIDMLGSTVRQAGRVAAVIGRRFSVRLFDEVFDERPPSDRGTLHPDVAALESHGILRLEAIQPELEFSFRHALIHDVMYEGLLRKERTSIHRDVAAAMERLYPDRLDELAAPLGRHYAEAGNVEIAVPYLFTAGKWALLQGARVEAAGFYGHAQDLLLADPEADPGELIDAVIGRLNAGMGFVSGPTALGWIDDMLDRARELDDPDRLARLYERAIWTRGMQGETYASPEYRQQLDAGYGLIPRLTDQGTIALLEAMMGAAYRSRDQYEASLEPLAGAIDGLEASGRLAEASYNASMLAQSLSLIGRFDEAIAAVDRATEIGGRSGDPNAILDAELIRGSILADRGALEEAVETTRRGIEAAEAEGNTFCNLAGNFMIADQQLRLGNVDEAIIHLEQSTGLAQFCNAGGYEALGHAWLAAARARNGDLRPDDFDDPLQAAIGSGSRSAEGMVRMQRAIAFAGAERHDTAAADFERAIELFADYGGLPNLARAHHAYGQALEAAGEADRGAEHLRTAERLFADLGISADQKV